MKPDETHKNATNLMVEIGVMIENAVENQMLTRIQAIGLLEGIKARLIHDVSKATLE